MTSVYGYVQALDYTYKTQPLFEAAKKVWKPVVGSITDVLQNHPFMKVIKLGGYEAFFGDVNNYFTLFVPEKIPDNIDVLYAKNVVRFSTLPTVASIELISQQSSLNTIYNNENLNVYQESGGLVLHDLNNPVVVVKPNVYVANGVIHYTNIPLVPSFYN